MNELQRILVYGGGIPLDHFLEASNRAVARLGPDVVMDDAGSDEIARELYAMALERPEEEVFS